MRSISLRTTMILWIWGVTALVFGLTIVADFHFTKEKVEKFLETSATDKAQFYTKKFDLIFNEAALVAKMMEISFNRRYTGIGDKSQEELLKEYLKLVLEANPYIHSVSMAFEPGQFSTDSEKFSPIYFRQKDRIDYLQLGEKDNYNYLEKAWYFAARDQQKTLWTEPYRSEVSLGKDGKEYMLLITHSQPLFRDGKVIGVVVIDISLDEISQKLSELKILKSGYCVAMSNKGVLLNGIGNHKALEKNIHELSPEMAAELKDLDKIATSACKFIRINEPAGNRPAWIVLRPLRHAGIMAGSIAFVYPVEEIRGVIYDLQAESSLLGFFGLILMLIIVITISRSIARPICALAHGVGKVAHGELDHKIEVLSKIAEVTAMQSSFNKMSDDLKTYMRELKETVAARERIENELKIAHQIQASMLPRIFPPFPDRKEIGIFGLMEPAKEVGGDFYDFFFINPDKFCMVVADVSGKGIAAALFMVITKTLLRTEAMNDLPPEEILGRVNNMISADNDELMFVTVFLAILDTRTGELSCANAGHNPPLLSSAPDNTFSFEYLKLNKNVVLGVMPDITFKPNSFKMRDGDVFFLYTDGVNEAMNVESAQFTDKRLRDTLNANCDKEVTSLVKELRKEVATFTNGAAQSDDITMLAIKFNGPENQNKS